MNDAARPSPQMLEGVADAWRRSGRVIEAAFGGGSMRPTMAPGQPVTVDCARAPRVGDVIAFRVDAQLIVHRLVRLHADWLLTWGDANALPDMPVRASQWVGTVVDIAAVAPARSRAVWLALLAPRGAGFDAVARRVALAWALRNGWRAGPRGLLARAWRKLAKLAGARSRVSA